MLTIENSGKRGLYSCEQSMPKLSYHTDSSGQRCLIRKETAGEDSGTFSNISEHKKKQIK